MKSVEWLEGVTAARDGLDWTANLYPNGSVRRTNWASGHKTERTWLRERDEEEETCSTDS